MNCVVLGSNGFIGTNLVQKLIAFGTDVRGFGRQKPNEYIEGISWIKGDFANQEILTSAIRGCEVVYHLIDDSIPASMDLEQSKTVLSSVLNTINLLEICKKEGVRKVIYISSGGTVYGLAKLFPILEASPTEPICAYGINKLTIEKYLNLYHHLYGLDYSVVRLSNPFGPHQNTLKAQGIIAKLISNSLNNKVTEIWGNGKTIRDYIYINDVVNALVKLAVYSGPNKIFNLGSGIGRSINDIIYDLEKIMGGDKIRVNYNNSQRIIDVPVNILNVELIKNQLDWYPEISWLDALKTTFKQYKVINRT